MKAKMFLCLLSAMILFVSCEKDNGEEDTPFKVVSVSPANGTTSVSLDPTIVIVFNKKPNQYLLTGSYMGVSGGNHAVGASITYDGNVTVTMRTSTLEPNTYYTIHLNECVESAGGTPLERFESIFVTGD